MSIITWVPLGRGYFEAIFPPLCAWILFQFVQEKEQKSNKVQVLLGPHNTTKDLSNVTFIGIVCVVH